MTNETNNLSRAARGLNSAFQVAVITSICVELYEYGKKKYAEYKSRKGTATAIHRPTMQSMTRETSKESSEASSKNMSTPSMPTN